MKRTGLLLLVILFSTGMFAQTPELKGLGSINTKTAEAYIEYLASDGLEGREAGTRGGRLAGEYIVSVLKAMGIEPLYDSYYEPFEAYARERQKRGRFTVEPDSIRYIRMDVHRKLSLRNVLGKIEGRNPHEYVIIGAHYDHIGMDTSLVGDQIYNGADDNASGVSAVLQIARAFLATGIQPERTVIFAFWDGEEKGLLGSRYFVSAFPDIKSVKGYLNFDMIGRNNKEDEPTHFVYFYSDSHPAFGKWLKEDIQQYKLDLTPAYRPWDKPLSGSDNASFAAAGIPIIWYHTDGHPDYHMPGDEPQKLNWAKLVDITKASFLSFWYLANRKY